MESEVQEASQVPRSELDSAFDVSRAGGWMVVQSMPTTPWGYELHYLGREADRRSKWLPTTMVVSCYR